MNDLNVNEAWFARSRERRARIMDGLAVALLMALMAALGCAVLLASAPHAKADTDSMVYAYAATYGTAVCETLDDYPSFDGIIGIASAIAEDGLTMRQAGAVIALSANEICPRHISLVKAFASIYGGQKAIA